METGGVRDGWKIFLKTLIFDVFLFQRYGTEQKTLVHNCIYSGICQISVIYILSFWLILHMLIRMGMEGYCQDFYRTCICHMISLGTYIYSRHPCRPWKRLLNQKCFVGSRIEITF